MASINQEVKERLGALRDVSRAVRKIDTAVERTQRLLKRLTSRKKALPDEKDLTDVISVITSIADAVNAVIKIGGSLADVWKF